MSQISSEPKAAQPKIKIIHPRFVPKVPSPILVDATKKAEGAPEVAGEKVVEVEKPVEVEPVTVEVENLVEKAAKGVEKPTEGISVEEPVVEKGKGRRSSMLLILAREVRVSVLSVFDTRRLHQSVQKILWRPLLSFL
ncbi:hypothetical protein Hdeb2414_s0030g00708211 [Helianthus debilis subsp. tardiflorus]